jgi:hypothetical protein
MPCSVASFRKNLHTGYNVRSELTKERSLDSRHGKKSFSALGSPAVSQDHGKMIRAVQKITIERKCAKLAIPKLHKKRQAFVTPNG